MKLDEITRDMRVDKKETSPMTGPQHIKNLGVRKKGQNQQRTLKRISQVRQEKNPKKCDILKAKRCFKEEGIINSVNQDLELALCINLKVTVCLP